MTAFAKRFAQLITKPVLALVLGSIAGNSTAEDFLARSHQQTTIGPNARYEVVQSTLAARLTFRLDRFTGRVWQIVRTKDDDTAWEEMQVRETPKLQNPNRPRFQLFTSGIAARHTFLIDGDTGKTWLVVNSKKKGIDGSQTDESVWQPFAE